jgi:hypothetical protein
MKKELNFYEVTPNVLLHTLVTWLTHLRVHLKKNEDTHGSHSIHNYRKIYAFDCRWQHTRYESACEKSTEVVSKLWQKG